MKESEISRFQCIIIIQVGLQKYQNPRVIFGGCTKHRYDVYDIELPNMLYNITVRLLQYEGRIVDTEKGTEMANWTTVSTFYLSPSKTMGRSADGKVRMF